MNYNLESNMNTRTLDQFMLIKKYRIRSVIYSDDHVHGIAPDLITSIPLEIKLMFITRKKS